MKNFIFKKIKIHPLHKVFISFISLITIGTFLLAMPFSTYSKIEIIDAIFTSTSAVCVTGLIVLDTAKDFTLAGRIIILLLIQFGGFGIMTFSLGLVSLLKGNLSLKWRTTFEGMYDQIGEIPIKKILVKVMKYTFVIESITAIILFSQFYKHYPLGKAIEHSIFQAVSAFCNAGFSTFSDSLVKFNDNYIIIVTVSFAVILGGLGFIVLYELSKFRFKNFLKFFSSLTIHTKLVIVTSLILIILGTMHFYLLEVDFALKEMTTGKAILNSFFQSITCRTAGFNSVDIAGLRESTHLIMILLMFIGGAPGSIAGGIKITTIAVIFLLIRSKLKGKKHVSIWGRTLDNETIDRSNTLFVLSIIFIFITSFLMLTIRNFDINHSFISIIFEAVSAFGTVGLSIGITKQLPGLAKVFLSLVMLIGRLGPLTFVMAITLRKRSKELQHPRGHIMIG